MLMSIITNNTPGLTGGVICYDAVNVKIVLSINKLMKLKKERLCCAISVTIELTRIAFSDSIEGVSTGIGLYRGCRNLFIIPTAG